MYNLVEPKDFTIEHIDYIEKFKEMIKTLSDTTDTLMGAKDIDSRHIISTSSHAKIVGLKKCGDVTGRLDMDMPCEGTAQYAEQFVQADKSLLDTGDVTRGIVILNVHNYSDGIKARLFKKFILKHDPSKSILGTIYSGQDIDLTDMLNIMPSYITQFGKTGSIDVIDQNSIIFGKTTLTNYEQEICFLLLLNWKPYQIANFMNNFRPSSSSRTPDAIIKKKNYICDKLGIGSYFLSDLKDFLVSVRFHTKVPLSFIQFIIGSRTIREISIPLN